LEHLPKAISRQAGTRCVASTAPRGATRPDAEMKQGRRSSRDDSGEMGSAGVPPDG